MNDQSGLWAITGAAGFVGRSLVGRCADIGIEWRGLARSGDGHSTVVGDVRDADAVAALVRGATVVVHLAAYVHRGTRSAAEERECWSINVDGTQAIIDAVSRDAFVIFVSSANVYGSTEDALTEEARPRPRTIYGRSKLEAERRFLEAVRAGRFRGCVLRPAMVFGPGAPGNLARLARMVRSRLVVEIAGGGQRKSIVPIETMLDAIELVAARQSETNGEVFNVAGGEAMTIHEINQTIAAALAVRPLVIPLPRAITRVVPRCFASIVDTYARSAALDDAKLRHVPGFAAGPATRDALTAMFRRA